MNCVELIWPNLSHLFWSTNVDEPQLETSEIDEETGLCPRFSLKAEETIKKLEHHQSSHTLPNYQKSYIEKKKEN